VSFDEIVRPRENTVAGQRLGDDHQPCFHGQRRQTRRSCLVALEAGHALLEIPLLPAPDRGFRRLRAPRDLEGAMTIRRRQHDLCSPDELARGVAVADQSLKLSTVGGAKVKGRCQSVSCPEYDTPNHQCESCVRWRTLVPN